MRSFSKISAIENMAEKTFRPMLTYADECHRAVSPKTKRELERFFGRSLWYGFTGTPRFAENPYPQMGDLPRTTEELYGKCLHRYTIQNAIDYEYIINLIQNIVTPNEDAGDISPEERQKMIDEVKQYIGEMRKDNPKVAEIMTNLVSEIETDEDKYKGKSILNIVENMKHDCIDRVISDFCITWYASKEDVMYAALHYRNGEIPNESVIKATIDYQSYKSTQEKALPKFRYYSQCMAELKKILEEEIRPLISAA